MCRAMPRIKRTRTTVWLTEPHREMVDAMLGGVRLSAWLRAAIVVATNDNKIAKRIRDCAKHDPMAGDGDEQD